MKNIGIEIKNLLLASVVITAFVSCTNMSSLKSKSTTSTVNPAFSSSSGFNTHVLQNVNISTGTTGNPPDLLLSLATAPGLMPLTQYCQVGASSTNPCVCVLKWTELNTVGGASVSIPRTRKLIVSQVQTALVRCQMTQSFWNEIPAGTSMHMNIEPVSPNVSGLSVQQIGYKKGTSVAPAGDFVDDTLTPFRNIFHYSCFSKMTASHEVLSGSIQTQIQNSSGASEDVNIFLASRFCAASGNNCPTPRGGYSAQSYYRNLYVRSDKTGEINSMNARYDCPKVFESLSHVATTPPSVPSPEQNKYWPLDSTFALATTANSEWSVQVPAASVLMKNGDPIAVDDAGISASNRLQEIATTNAGIAWKILGYAKLPNSNGTCGSIVDSNGQSRPLTRLRRFRVVYPSGLQNSGQVLQERPEADQIYVPDRLVVDVSGNHTGNMIYGPKPCNFSWFDHEGVTNRPGGANFKTNISGSVPIYQATNNYYYDPTPGSPTSGDEVYVNPDARILPNLDRDGSVAGPIYGSCSASIPVYDYTMGLPTRVRLITSNFNRDDWVKLGARKFFTNEIHLGAVEPWVPEYVEDTSFKACVPVSNTYREPPLHFYRENASGGKVAWCSKVYPTQNPFWLDLNSDRKPTSNLVSSRAVNWTTGTGAPVAWYTSHSSTGGLGLDSYNSNPNCTSTPATHICEWSLGSTTNSDYPGCVNYLNNHLSTVGATSQNRCDRTVMFDPNMENRGFPLQASDAGIRTMLKNDLSKSQSFACNYSVHANPAMVNQFQPLTNCCGSKNGTPILDEATLKLIPDTPANQGHLEPYVDPAFPNIRYCGNPVE